MDNLIAKIYGMQKTVFNTRDIALIWEEKNRNNLKSKISYYVRNGDIVRLKNGIFVKNKNYDRQELAASIYTPSYVSFETILREEGVIFQHYDTVFIAGTLSKELVIDDLKISFRKIKEAVLYNPFGIINKGNYSVASKERAFLDMIYLFPGYYFDNLKSINWEKCNEMVKIYGNKQMAKRLRAYHKENK
ncbi:MAG: hypothetical protein WC878_03555 [Candidatus Paceibacterota bacterium]|jgi:predicted transcriptional regulator of viral defense system